MIIDSNAMHAINQTISIAQRSQFIADKVFSGEGSEEDFKQLRKSAEDLRVQIHLWESFIPIQEN